MKSIVNAFKRGGNEEQRRDVNTDSIISLLKKDEHEKVGDSGSRI